MGVVMVYFSINHIYLPGSNSLIDKWHSSWDLHGRNAHTRQLAKLTKGLVCLWCSDTCFEYWYTTTVGKRMNARIVIVMNTNSFLLDCSIEVREKKKIALIRSFRVAQGDSLANVRFPRVIGLWFSTTHSCGATFCGTKLFLPFFGLSFLVVSMLPGAGFFFPLRTSSFGLWIS